MHFLIVLFLLIGNPPVFESGISDFRHHATATVDGSFFIHSVYFWLGDDVSDAQKADFLAFLESFRSIKSVMYMYIGTPSMTPRDVVDNSYDVALIVYFRDKEGHDAYQVDPIHKEAVTIFRDWIREIRIYDVLTGG